MRRTRIEDYLAAIDAICLKEGIDRAGNGELAAAVGVAKGTASGVVKSLAAHGLIDHVPYAGARLTEAGQQRARHILRRYRLLEMFLSQTLGTPKDQFGAEAWELEPGASEQLIEQIDRFLNHPRFDSRGDPIPHKDGSMPASGSLPH